MPAATAANTSIGGGGSACEEFASWDAGSIFEYISEERLGDGRNHKREEGAEDGASNDTESKIEEEPAQDFQDAPRPDSDGDGGNCGGSLDTSTSSKRGPSSSESATEDLIGAFEGVIGRGRGICWGVGEN